MNVVIIKGHMRAMSNTNCVAEKFEEVLLDKGHTVTAFVLRDMTIDPCTACWQCQDHFEAMGCSKKDDVHLIFEALLKADLFFFASPIYSWYCTPTMKALMDRLVYTMNKYYGEVEGPCLWENKKVGLITTSGYEREDGAGVFEEGVKRYATHSKLQYVGMLHFQDVDDRRFYANEQSVSIMRAFEETL